MIKWQSLRADEFCYKVTDGTHDSPKPQSYGHKLITSKHLKGSYIDFESANWISEADYQKVISRSSVEQWDVLFSMIGTVGRTYIEKSNQIDYACKNMGIFKFNGNQDDAYWMYYYLNSPTALSYIQSHLYGSTQTYVSLGTLREMPVLMPPKSIRNKIVRILRLLDDKIDINNEINNNLAAQIRAVCNSWLNDYVPFNGKCPDDWVLIPLYKFARFISGYSYKGSELQASSIAMATIKNFDRKGGFKLDGYKEIIPSSKLKPEHHANLFETLVAHTDLTQNAEVIGNAEPILSFSGYNDIVFSMDLVKVIPKDEAVSKFLIAAILQTQQFKSHCLGYVNGTTVLHLSKKALPEYSLMLPTDFSVLKPLDEVITSMYKQMSLKIDENLSLEQLRDSLLPKLMSGELDVSEIDL